MSDDAAPSPGVRAPWSKDQVNALNAFQTRSDVHPFTCPGDHAACEGRRELVAEQAGWVCKCGTYRQDWAHAAMMEPRPVTMPPKVGNTDLGKLDRQDIGWLLRQIEERPDGLKPLDAKMERYGIRAWKRLAEMLRSMQ